MSLVRRLGQGNALKKSGLGAGSVAQLVEYLPTAHEAPGSIPSTAETGHGIHL